MKILTGFLNMLVEFCCKTVAFLIIVVGAGCLLVGGVMMLGCLTGDASCSIGVSVILLLVGGALFFILTHMPEGFYDNLEF